ncbi:RNA methyltransferase [Shewanella sp. WXL01]|uniref:TrmH family RNA methyltransferase n=1 Tax=Shewanella maritima TaxID=2520507 RepID=A0A411PKQ5_9GAMM|nr:MULTISPECIES: RNA methyltransferase [Shewanella]NKF51158.1 RNA methyltransferase [Shewanella sp. WXL01]QBF84107.1 TrmH family RNA methyltransferase [Shewanella maritima]
MKNQVSIGLINPKTPTNVNGVMRACGCYQASQVFYTGNRYDYAKRAERQFEVDTQNVAAKIPLTRVEELLESVPEQAKIVCVDLVVGATPLPEFTHPENAFYIFGPEDGTIPQQIIDAADEVVYVPTVGCMNLAASANVLLYDRLAKSSVTADDELIKQSRDTNNRTRVKHWLK